MPQHRRPARRRLKEEDPGEENPGGGKKTFEWNGVKKTQAKKTLSNRLIQRAFRTAAALEILVELRNKEGESKNAMV